MEGSFRVSFEVSSELEHRLVVRAADGLRIDAQREAIGDLHLAIVQHR